MRKRKQDPAATARQIAAELSSDTDPQGSYTGRPADPTEPPVQDADDL